MTERSFDITWRDGAYYVSIPNYKGGKVYTGDLVEDIRERFRDAKESAKTSAAISLNSYGAGYDLGYADALGELLESITDDVSAATERNDG
ncbi:hypothetical protein [Bradyrhizobium tunisiense]|uniref:hypothetical protein n=1 Tax=Bradyrhizobium tunisiense TaxID=3278709 RepID=UPI0035E27AA9